MDAPDKLVNHVSEGKGKVKRNERGPGVIWVNFAGYVPLASQNPYPILWSILWPNIDPILVTL